MNDAQAAHLREQVFGWPHELTLGQATEILRHIAEPTACACVGGPWCCIRVHRQAEALHRGAHIVAKLITDLASRQGP